MGICVFTELLSRDFFTKSTPCNSKILRVFFDPNNSMINCYWLLCFVFQNLFLLHCIFKSSARQYYFFSRIYSISIYISVSGIPVERFYQDMANFSSSPISAKSAVASRLFNSSCVLLLPHVSFSKCFNCILKGTSHQTTILRCSSTSIFKALSCL